jgi:hypothetical protein
MPTTVFDWVAHDGINASHHVARGLWPTLPNYFVDRVHIASLDNITSGLRKDSLIA